MLHIRVTGGYTGKAKSCIEAWVPAVSIHRPLSFYNLKKSRKENNYKQIYIGVKNGGTVQGERGREEERGAGAVAGPPAERPAQRHPLVVLATLDGWDAT